MQLQKAEKIAKKIIRKLEPFINKIEIAGSIRRKRPEVKDIEIVLELVTPSKVFLNQVTREMEAWELAKKIQILKNGPRYKQFWLLTNKNPETNVKTDLTFQLIKVDLFLVHPPAFWGPIFTIRTGPDKFSKWLVSHRKPEITFSKGQMIQGGSVLTATTEERVFEYLDLEFIKPEDRDQWIENTLKEN